MSMMRKMRKMREMRERIKGESSGESSIKEESRAGVFRERENRV